MISNTPHSIQAPTNPRPVGTPEVAIILLNWNGWKDTIECLESVFRINYSAFTVVVCDNASTDGSLDRIRAWADGFHEASGSSPALAPLVIPPVPKPVRHVTLDPLDPPVADSPRVPLVLIPTGANRGFAGGNNMGLRYALAQPRIEYFWLLNSDTVVEPHALGALVDVMQGDPGLGLCGSVLRNYASPESVLTLGGRSYNRWTGRTKPILPGAAGANPARIPHLDYIEAASLLTRRCFLEMVGLMNEDYFLYFEEMDWVMRARGRFRFSYSPQSIVYHKEGRKAGSHRDRNQRSPLSDYFQARNRIKFTQRYFPWMLPTMFASIAGTALHRLFSGRQKNAAAVVKGVLAALHGQRDLGA